MLAVACAAPKPGARVVAERPIAKAKATALAKAALPRAADLPGWHAVPPRPDSPGDAAFDRRLNECMGRIPTPDAATAQASFAKGPERIDAGVDVVGTLAQADGDLADLRNPAFRDCLVRALALPGTVRVSARHVPVTVRGSDGAAAIVLEAANGARSAAVVLVGARVGHTEVMVVSEREVGERAMPSPAELAGLLAKLVPRVRKAEG
jgi:hypothetical protein